MKRVISFIVILNFCLFTNYSFSQSENWEEIESAFQNYDTTSMSSFNCQFEYEDSSYTPDVDVFDLNYKFILGDITKKEVLTLVEYYYKYCDCNVNLTKKNVKLLYEIKEFLVYDIYAINLSYQQLNAKTTGLICLIYNNNNQYLLFSIDTRIE